MSHKDASVLRESGHDVVYVNEHQELRGLPDKQHAENAQSDNRVLVSRDADFGELRHNQGLPTTGVVYVKPSVDRESNSEHIIARAIDNHSDDLNRGAFVTVDADKTRVRELDSLKSSDPPSREQQQSATPIPEQKPAEQPSPQAVGPAAEPAAKQEPSSFRERIQAKQKAAEIKKVEPPPEPAPSQGLSR